MPQMKKIGFLLITLISGQIIMSKSWDLSHLQKKKIDTSFKCYMDGKYVTDISSRQYGYVHNPRTIIGNYGIYNLNNKYLVALSPRYGKIGDTVKITLDTGVQLNVIISDFKKHNETKLGWGMHKISKNQNCLLEFIVDSNKVSKKILKTGDFSRIYPGQIIKIENNNM